uniref:Carboxylesterase type B domain-containing protein n=1 Tax=Panagrolaimus sp. ES5 TaxID=591445 RepID=A0AC34FVZ0_9BILA
MVIKIGFHISLAVFVFLLGQNIFAEEAPPLPVGYVKDITETTPIGPVTGFVAKLSDDFNADIFLGIPFAQPPIEDLRFEKPEPVIPWSSPLLAQKFPPACWPHHLSGLPISMFSDDCLYLNIFRPHDNTTRPSSGWPVLVWVHGGGYVVGATFMYGYQNISLNFATQGLIVVTIQYRLAFSGFSSTGDSEMPGNLGYWDQTEAFKFLKQNIANFGGDPKKIVAFGLSAGGGSTAALSMSPHSRDYISSSIEMSGSVYANWASSDMVVAVTKQVAREIGCPETSAELKKCYQKTKPEKFLEAIERIGPARRDINLVKYNPRIDGDFFPKDFTELIKEFPPKPALIGFTDQEAGYFTIMGLSKTLNQIYIPKEQFKFYGRENFTNFVEFVLAPKSVFNSKAKEVQQKIIQFYLGKDKMEHKYDYYLLKYTDMLSDILFNIPALWGAREKVEANWPVYLYMNDYFNKDMFGDDIPVKGSMHANEYPYMFGIFAISNFEFNDDDYKTQKVIIDSIVAFTKNSNPSTPSLKWPQLTAEKPFQSILINANPKLMPAIFSERLQFWDDLCETYDFNIIRGIYKKSGKSKDEL